MIFLLLLLVSVFVGIMAGTLAIYYSCKKTRAARWSGRLR
jgi:hypothetical protein